MAYGGNEIAWENLAQSLKDKLESSGGVFGAKSKVVASWNDALDNGFYVSNGDAPTNEWYIGETISDDVGSRVVQRIMPYGKTIDYIRTKTDNVWSDWVKNDYMNTVKSTTETISWYVSPTGNDTTGDGTQAKPFKTIQATINKVPKVLNHNATIRITEGTYDEKVVISGFMGSGVLSLAGMNTSSLPQKVKSISIIGCSAYVSAVFLNITETTGEAITIKYSVGASLNSCIIDGVASTSDGIGIYTSMATVSSCTISNKRNALYVINGSMIYISSMSGTNNVVGYKVSYGGTIAKYSSSDTRPSATTAEVVDSGGLIR